eukprot:UN02952
MDIPLNMSPKTYTRYDKQMGLVTRYLYISSIINAVKTELSIAENIFDGVNKASHDFSWPYKRYARNSLHGFGVMIGSHSKQIIWCEMLSKQSNFAGSSLNMEPCALNHSVSNLYNIFGYIAKQMALDGDNKSRLILNDVSIQFALDFVIKICPDKAHIISKAPRKFVKYVKESIQIDIDKAKNKKKTLKS